MKCGDEGSDEGDDEGCGEGSDKVCDVGDFKLFEGFCFLTD